MSKIEQFLKYAEKHSFVLSPHNTKIMCKMVEIMSEALNKTKQKINPLMEDYSDKDVSAHCAHISYFIDKEVKKCEELLP